MLMLGPCSLVCGIISRCVGLYNHQAAYIIMGVGLSNQLAWMFIYVLDPQIQIKHGYLDTLDAKTWAFSLI